jgi:hypothetical protein
LDPSRCAGWGGKEKRVSSMVVNFPDGSKEFLYPSRELKEGDAVWHNGVRFRVLFDRAERRAATDDDRRTGLG